MHKLQRLRKANFVLMHCDEKIHQGKLEYKFQGLSEVMDITPVGAATISNVLQNRLS